MTSMATVNSSPYADRIEALLALLPPVRVLEAGKELLLCPEGDLGPAVTRWETLARDC